MLNDREPALLDATARSDVRATLLREGTNIMSSNNSTINIMELAAAMPNAILQISAGDLCDFAHRLIESATDVARLQIERANLSKELLTIEEVADMLKVSKMTLYRWNLNDTLPKIEIGGKRRYRRADVEASIEQRKEKKQWTRK